MDAKQLNEKLDQILNEAEGKVSDMKDIAKIGFIPMTLKQVIKKYHIPPTATLDEIKEKYRQAYNDFMNKVYKKISDAIGKPFPNSVWGLRIDTGKVYQGPNRIPVHNKLGEVSWYYTITKNDRTYTACRNEQEIIDILRTRNMPGSLVENFSDEYVTQLATQLRNLATNLEGITMEEGAILLKAASILNDIIDN